MARLSQLPLLLLFLLLLNVIDNAPICRHVTGCGQSRVALVKCELVKVKRQIRLGSCRLSAGMYVVLFVF